MEEQCRATIYAYADEETQMNAALFGEHKEYVEMVITLIRGDFHGQLKSGATEYIISDDIAFLLQEECPW